MKRNIIIIDDFYSNPDEVRQMALSSEYPEPDSGHTYPGKNSGQNYYPELLHQKFEKILNRKLIPAPLNGYFRLSMESDTCLQDIHVDPVWEWGAVIYLTDPKYCIPEGGTSFWMHDKTKMECLDLNQSVKLGYSSEGEFWKTTVYTDGLDRSKWTRTLLCPMRYNRLVVFRSNLWHSHNKNFGINTNNCRLVQLFFFNPVNFKFVE